MNKVGDFFYALYVHCCSDLHLRSCCRVLSHASTVHPHTLEGFYMGQAPGPKIRRIWADTIWALKYQPSFSTLHLYLLYPWHSRHFLATSLGPAFASLSPSYISTPSHQRLPGALIPHFQAALCSRLPGEVWAAICSLVNSSLAWPFLPMEGRSHLTAGLIQSNQGLISQGAVSATVKSFEARGPRGLFRGSALAEHGKAEGSTRSPENRDRNLWGS